MTYREAAPEDVARGQGGDRAAQGRVISACAAIITSELRRLGLVSDQDARQEGAIAVLRALRLFDPGRGVPFGAFCRLCLRSAVREYRYRSASLLKVPFGRPHRLALRRLMAGGVTDAETHDLWAAQHGRLGRPVDGDELWHRILPSTPATAEDSAAASERSARMLRAVAALPERQAFVLCRRLSGEPLERIGAHLGVTRERARQIEKGAVDSVRRTMGA